MSTAEILERLIETAPAVIAATAKPEVAGRCILATRLGLEVLRACGVQAEPWPVEALALNAAGVAWEDRGRQGDPRALGVRILHVSPDAEGPGIGGHLLIRVRAADLPGGWAVVDLDARQFQRPAIVREGVAVGAIDLPDALWWPTASPEGPWTAQCDTGAFLGYRTLPGLRYRHSPDWRVVWDGDRRRLIGSLVRAVRG